MRLLRHESVQSSVEDFYTEEKMKKIFDAISDFVFVLDRDSRFVRVNKATCDFLKKEPKELIGKRCFEVLHGTDKPLLNCPFEETLVTKKAATKEVNDPDLGLSLLVTISPIFDEKGELIGCVHVTKDITERKQMEEDLRKSEEKFRNIFESANDGLIYLDRSGRILDVNGKAVEVFGGSKKELLGKHFTRVGIFSLREIPTLMTNFAKILAGKKAALNVCIKNKKGQEISLECSSSFMKIGDKFAGILVIARDVTERKEAEERIRASEERYRRLIELAPDGILTLNMKGVVTSVNPAFLRMIGFSKDEIVGKHFTKSGTIRARDLPKHSKLIGFILKGKTPKPFEIAYVHKDGTQRWGEAHLSFLEDHGKRIGVQGILRDVTERKKAERKIRESEEKYRTLVENTTDFIHMIDDKDKVLSLNKSAARLFGKKPEEVVGKSIFELFPKEVATHFSKDLKKVFKRGRSQIAEAKMIAGGREMWISANLNPVRDHEGKVIAVLGVTRDLTERKQTEEALKESEERFRQLIEYAPDAIYINNLKGNFIHGNKQAEKLTGYKKDELIGKNMPKIGLLPKKYLPKAMKALTKNLLGQKTGPDEFELIRKDGTRATVEISTFPVKREEKVEVIGIARDITERKKAEEALRQSEEKYHSLVENIPDVTWTFDSESHPIFISPRIKEVFGFTPEEIYQMGDRFAKGRTHPDDREYVQEAYDLLFTRNKIFDVEYRMQRKDGRWIWIHDSAVTTRKKDGVMYADGVLSDITERKRTEEKLKLFSQSVDSSIDGMAMGNPEGKIIYVNEAFVRMFGYSREELIGKPITFLHPEDQIPKLEEALKATMEGGWTGELVGKRKNGELFPIAISSSRVVDDEGKIIVHMASHRDITERKQMEKKLEEYSQQLGELVEKRTRQLRETQEQLLRSERLATIGEVAAMVGHDLRNPLTGIAGATYYLKTKFDSKMDKKTKDILELIEKDIDYSNKIINSLLDYSKEIRLELAETTPKTIIKDALTLVKVPKNIQILDFTKNEPKIEIDTQKMKRVFVNIIKNAVDAMPEGGRLTITSKESNGNLEIAFTDTGTGIPKDIVEKIWTPLFTTKAKGMGLGLSICKRIVEAHRGSISAESTVEKGATFTVTLPTKPKIEGGEKTWVNIPESLLLTTTKA